MGERVAIIGVGQSAFVRGYPGSIRELAFEAFREAMEDAKLEAKDIDASIVASAPEYDRQRSPDQVITHYRSSSIEDITRKIPYALMIYHTAGTVKPRFLEKFPGEPSNSVAALQSGESGPLAEIPIGEVSSK